MNQNLQLEICIAEPSEPFICGVTGRATVDTLRMIESQLPEWMEIQTFDSSCESVHVTAVHVGPEYHDGRVAIEGYWDLTVIDPSADLDLLIADIEKRGWSWTLRKTSDVLTEQEETRGRYIAHIWTVAASSAHPLHYLGVDFGATPTAALAATLAQVHESAKAGA